MILAGDVGGTNTRLGVFRIEGGHVVPSIVELFSSRQQHLEEIVGAFVARHSLRVEFACFGVAGPVRDERVEATNLPWIVDARELAGRLDGSPVWLLNDLEANAYGVAELAPRDLFTLNTGVPDADHGNQAVIAAGTGLGEAGLFWNGEQYLPFGSEGGHADFAPTDELQIALLRHLMRKYGSHVSWERVLSGPGLLEIYEFLREEGSFGAPSPALLEEMRVSDPSAAVAAAGLSGASPLATKALDLFVEFYGAEAGNLALKLKATGGVYLGGGIAPKILFKLQEPRFVEAFLAKGRLKAMLSAIPVRVILADKTALTGAARCAAIRGSLLRGKAV